jgi:hypothetical protein
MPMRRVRQFYIDSGADMFDRASLLKRFYCKFEDDKLSAKLQSELGPERDGDAASGLATLGSPRLKTLFMAVTRNATTDSPWPFTNYPRSKYNQRVRPDCNLLLPLWKVVRASGCWWSRSARVRQQEPRAAGSPRTGIRSRSRSP